jgi:hypothetical protein
MEVTTMVLRILRAIVLVAIVLGTNLAVEAGVTPANLCKDSKAKDTGLYALSLTKTFGRNGKVPNLVRLACDLSKAQSKITKGFTKAEFSGSGVPRGCVTTGDVVAIQAKADSLAEDVLDEVGGVTSTTTTTTPSTTTTTAVPIPCELSGYPMCGGNCPLGTQCQATFGWVDDGPQCKCVEAFGSACNSYSPYCGPPARCPPGEVCVWASHPTPLQPCGCAPPPLCWGSAYPACGGNCPPGLDCISDPFFGPFCLCL